MAQNDLEKQAIDDFYEEYKNKYARKLEGWQEVIDMYAEQELQKIEEEKQYKEQQYRQQKERERQKALRKARTQETVSLVRKQNLRVWVLMLLWELVKHPVTLPVIANGKGAQTQTVSSTGITPTPSIRDSQVVDTSGDVAWQREQGRLDALRTAATLRGTGGTC